MSKISFNPQIPLAMKPLLRHATKSIASFLTETAMLLPLTAAETKTSTQISQANNLASKNFGVVLSVPDFLERNVNDDQVATDLSNYEKWDRDHVPSPAEKDLKEVTVTAKTGDTAGVLTLTVSGNVAAITCPVSGFTNTIYWSDKEKNARYPQSNHTPLSWNIPANTPSFSVILYIEGVETSAAPADIKFVAELTCGGGSAKATGETAVYEVDLDIDSDNDNKLNAPSRSKEEDVIEASEKIQPNETKRPSKYVFVNAGFNAENEDACPGWADGFDINPNSNNDNKADVFGFTPIIINLPEPFDPKTAEIEFIYKASDPKDVIVTASPGLGTPTDPFTYALASDQSHPPDASLRIWMKDNPVSRNKSRVTEKNLITNVRGDFVPAAKFLWSTLTNQRQITLYLETVRPSAALGDLGIQVIASEGNVRCEDKINVTSVYFQNPLLDFAVSGTGYSMTTNFSANKCYFTNSPNNTKAITYTFKADWLPNNVEPEIYPMEEIVIGLMQNLKSSTLTLGRYTNPNASDWDDELPQGYALTEQSVYLRKINPPNTITRMNDCKIGSEIFPLFSSSALPHNAQNLPKPGINGNDTDTPSIISAYFAEIKRNESMVTWINTYMDMDSRFVAWTCGYNSVNKQFYPLCERNWSLIAKSNDVPNTKPDVTLLQTNPTLIPVRDPIASTEYQKLLQNNALSPDIQAGTTKLTKP